MVSEEENSGVPWQYSTNEQRRSSVASGYIISVEKIAKRYFLERLAVSHNE